MDNLQSKKPSRKYCETGILPEGEKYDQEIHNYGKTPKERCSKFYEEYNKKGGNSKKTFRIRKNKKSRKNHRKSNRRTR
jgi:hypothetical protein